jgi:hypothetical protein
VERVRKAAKLKGAKQQIKKKRKKKLFVES